MSDLRIPPPPVSTTDVVGQLDAMAAADAEVEEHRSAIEAALAELKAISEQPECMVRLHAIEQLMVHDVLTENRHLKCRGCLHWMRALVHKAKGEEWR